MRLKNQIFHKSVFCLVLFSLVYLRPQRLLATGVEADRDLVDIFDFFLMVIDYLLLITAGLAFLAFVWGIAVFIHNAGDAEKRKQGRQLMIWGVIALFVLTTLTGIIMFLRGAFLGDYTPADDDSTIEQNSPGSFST